MNINNKKAELIITKLHQYFEIQGKKNYASLEIPDEIETGSKEWLLYLFYSCLLNYGMKSKIYHQNLINTYHKFPEIFEPNEVLERFSRNSEQLFEILKENVHPRYPNVALKKWMELSLELSKIEDLLEMITQFSSFHELDLYIKSIKGYGQKTGGLLLRFIYESGILKWNDDLPSIPLDRHDIEISYLNGIIDRKKINEKEIKELSNTYIKIGKKMDIKPNQVDQYLWEIGNQFCNKKDCKNCPLNDSCKTKQ